MLAGGMLATPVAADDEIETTTEITQILAEPYAFVPVTFYVHTDTAAATTPGPCGTVKIFETTSGSPVEIASIEHPCDYTATLLHEFPDGFDLGTHSFVATYDPTPTVYANSESEPVDYVVGVAPSFISLWSDPGSPVEAHQSFILEAPVGVNTGNWTVDATVTFRRSGSTTPLCVVPVPESNLIRCTASIAAPGTYTITAEYSGNTWAEGSTSDPIEMIVTADQVHASGVGTSYTTFFPVDDGYRDELTMKGTRGEPIGVTIKVFSPGGSLLKTKTINQGSGAYSWDWSGRRADGSIYPEGEYKITQTLKDAFNTTKAYTHFVKLSKKKLTWHAHTITKKGTGFTVFGYEGDGSVAVDTTAGVVRLRSPNSFAGDWAAVGYQFTLNSGVTYKSITVSVYARRGLVAAEATRLGAQDFGDCAYSTGPWFEDCFDTWKTIGNASNTTQWYTTNTLTSTHRSGTKVRSMVSNRSSTTFVYKAKVTYKYSTLGY